MGGGKYQGGSVYVSIIIPPKYNYSYELIVNYIYVLFEGESDILPFVLKGRSDKRLLRIFSTNYSGLSFKKSEQSLLLENV